MAHQQQQQQQWRCKIDGQEVGPFDGGRLTQLARAGELLPHDLIWNPAAEKWSKADRLQGLVFGPPSAARRAAAAAAGATAPAGLGAPTPAAVAAADHGPFHTIAGSFRVAGGGTWSGTALASPRALYLLKVGQQSNHVHGSGLVGYLVREAVAGRDDEVRSCCLGELPPHLRAELDPNGLLADRDVVVLPRFAVNEVRTSFWRGGLVVRCGGDEFALYLSTFKAGRSKAFLVENGWVLDRPVEPTGAPVHGTGREPGEPNPYDRSFAERLAYGAVALIVIGAYVYYRVYSRLPSAYGR